MDEQSTYDDILSKLKSQVLPAVGSGAWRLSAQIHERCGVSLEKHREPICLWHAIKYILNQPNSELEAYRFVHRNLEESLYPISAPFPSSALLSEIIMPVAYDYLTDSFPILLVNIKTGTSFYRIDSPTDFVRVGGSSIGASTVHALGKSLVGVSSVPELVKMAAPLDVPSRVDLLVEDIYGGDCSSIGLPGSIIASCFGKSTDKSSSDDVAKNMCDISKSLIDFMCINTAQLANLHAQMNGCKRALIVGAIGSRDQVEVTECIQRVLNILAKSGGQNEPLEAIFFNQAKYLGCLGALLRRESLALGLRGLAIDTATLIDGVNEETYTKLRVLTPPRTL